MEDKFKCPRCGFEQSPAEECIKCGVIIKKYIEIQSKRDVSRGIDQYAQEEGRLSSKEEVLSSKGESVPSSMMTDRDMRPLGELFKGSWEIYKRRIGLLISILLLFLLFAAIVVGIFAGIGFLLSAALTESETKKAMIGLVAVIIGTVPGTIALFWGLAAFIYAVADERLGIRDAFRNGRKRLWPFIWILTLLAYIVTGGFLLFLLPGVIFWVWFSVALFILASEDERGMNALLKSKEYVRGHWFDVFLRLFIIGIISNVIGILPLIGPILTVVFMPFGAIFHYMIYSDLRALRKDAAYSTSGGVKCKWVGIGTLGYVIFPIIVLIVVGTFMIGALTGFLFNFTGMLKGQEITIKPGWETQEEKAPKEIIPPFTGMQSSGAELEGTWTMTRKTSRGAFELTFTGNDFDFRLTAKGETKTYKRGQVFINESTMPKRFDLRIAESSRNEDIGKIALGIFKIENSILTMCVNEPGETWRPSSFAPQQLEMPRHPDVFCIKLVNKYFLEQAGT